MCVATFEFFVEKVASRCFAITICCYGNLARIESPNLIKQFCCCSFEIFVEANVKDRTMSHTRVWECFTENSFDLPIQVEHLFILGSKFKGKKKLDKKR